MIGVVQQDMTTRGMAIAPNPIYFRERRTIQFTGPWRCLPVVKASICILGTTVS